MQDFIDLPGGLSMPQPYAFKLRSYMFTFKGDMRKFKNLVNSTLNAVLPDRDEVEIGEKYYRYVPFFDLAAFMFCDYSYCSSTNSDSVFKGNVPYNELAIALILVKLEFTKTKIQLPPKPTGIYYFYPYLWVDSHIAMVCGREIFGFNKSHGIINIPDGKGSDKNFDVSAFALKDRGESTTGKMQPIVSIAPKQKVEVEDAKWSGFDDMFKDYTEVLFNVSEDEEMPISFPSAPSVSFDDYWSGSTCFGVGMQQMRAANDPSKAIFSSVCEFEFNGIKLTGGGPVTGDFVLSLPEVAQYDIAETLGIQDGTEPMGALFMDYTFDMPEGKYVFIDR